MIMHVLTNTLVFAALYCLKEYDNALKILELGAESINDETERKSNTNLLQQSILQADYQELIRLAREGQSRHRAHDVKVWKGVLKEDVAGDSSGGAGDSKKTSTIYGAQGGMMSSPFAPLFLAGVVMLFIGIYFGSQ